MEFKIHTFDLPLKHLFRISHTSRTVQPTLIIELIDGNQSGLGEAAATSYYGYTIDKMVEAIEKNRAEIEAFSFSTPENLYQQLLNWFPDLPFIRCAFDIAAYDLYAKKQGIPLYQLWDLSIDNLPVSTYTIGIDNIEQMQEKVKQMPWPLYKIKLGTERDIEIIEALRQITTADFIVDANGGWTAKQTIDFSNKLKELGVLFIEQPLPKYDWRNMEQVYRRSKLPCFADESCVNKEDIVQCKNRFNGVNIKLTKSGGITPALELITLARQENLQIMLGCMTESSVGISAIAHLLPLVDYVDMDGALLLEKDIADGVKLADGKAIFPNRNGTGALLL